MSRETDKIIDALRDAAAAYPEDIFTPLTAEERLKYGLIITRASAAMGRQFGPLFTQAADALQQKDEATKIVEFIDRVGTTNSMFYSLVAEHDISAKCIPEVTAVLDALDKLYKAANKLREQPK